MSTSKSKLLLLGPRYSGRGAIGGIVVLFEHLVSEIPETTECTVIDTNSSNYSGAFTMLICVLRSVCRVSSYQHISIHGTARDYLIFGPIVRLVSMVFGKTYSLRKFAGNFDEYFESSGIVVKCILRMVLSGSKANFFETHSLVKYFERFNPGSTFFFPNVRKRQIFDVDLYKEGAFSIIFLSQVMRDKGVLELVAAVKNRFDVELTVAGPLCDVAENELLVSKNIKYVGCINPVDVCKFISQFHCLVLPTRFSGEGYPGVVIESYMVGLPVVVSNWRSLPELVGGNGVVLSECSPEEIYRGIQEVKMSHKEYIDRSKRASMLYCSRENSKRYFEKIA